MILQTQTNDIESLRNLIDATSTAIQIIGPDGLYLDCNKASYVMFNASMSEDIIGKPPSILSPEKQENGLDSGSESMKYIGSALSGELVTFEWNHRRLNGQTFPCQVTLQLVQYEQQSCLMATIVDITEIVALRRKAEFIMNNAPTPIIDVSPDFSILSVNTAFANMSDNTPAELVKMKVTDFVTENQVGGSWADAIKNKSQVSGELDALTSNNTRHLQYFYTPFYGEGNVLLSVVIYYIDKTEEKSAVRDIISLSEKCQVGILDTRLNAEHYQGEIKLLIQGINGTLDSIINPLNIAADYVSRIAKGDIPPRITETYFGDFNEIKESLNTCIDAVNLLITDANMLSDAALKGTLGTRADADKHQGDFRKIIDGVNGTLDSVIGPLNVAAEYVDRISKGDIPQKITDSYNGDFNEIKNNLNTCIDVISLLVSDTKHLATAAVEGKLDDRCDTTKHQGDFQKIVEGINTTLDHVVWPIREASRISRHYARGDFSARVDSHLGLSGEFGPFRDALNSIGIQMEEIITEINRVAGRYAAGDFSAQIESSLQVQGDLVPLRDALNKIGADVSMALTVVQNKMNDLVQHAGHASSGVEDVSRGAQMIAKNAEATKDNAERSQEGISQVLRTMEDLTKTISEVSANTEGVAQLTVSANEIARGGILFANDAEQGMAGITKTTSTVHKLITEIQTEMQKIGKIVQLITDIANQTNLLALNAAIEAARAGEAGRGFAVVAAEVKSLAQDSRNSAGNISEMINGLQIRTQEAAKAMEEAESAVKSGNVAVSGTLGSFQDLTQSVETIKEKMEIVASASEEQAASFEEITASVSEMSHQVGETAKQAMNSSSTSEEALAIVEQIQNVIEEINTVTSTINLTMGKFTIRR
ncbi:MAG TPA: methyl-accepting chemotaxis protein [Methanospirillum sp.]|nr:methyl-accepting chemotaxis protein [Methanospirillum sp.]